MKCPAVSYAAIVVVAFFTASSVKGAIWVSPDGDDANPGTEARPLLTLEHARDVVRTINQGMTEDLVVHIGRGTYRLDKPLVFGPSDSGTHGHRIIYEAAGDQRATISGGIAVKGWKLLDPARNLWTAPAPAGLAATRQLYIDGVRAKRTQGRLPVTVKETPTGYTASSPIMAAWKNPADIEFVYTGGNAIWSEPSVGLGSWTEPRCPVAAIEGTAITMVQPAWDNETKRVMYADPKFHRTANLVGPTSVGKQPAYVENAYELLGTPGQWYFDRPARALYYVPRPGEDMNRADIEAPVLEALIVGEGTAEQPVHDLLFKGLVFEYATWLFPSGPEGFPEIQANYLVTGEKGYAVQGLGELAPGGTSPYGAWTKTPGNVRFVRSSGVGFLDDAFVHLGAAGLELGDGSKNDFVEGCVFTDISANGCELGGVGFPDATEDLLTRDNRIVDNHLYNVGAEFHGGIPIVVGYAQRTRVAHNQIDHIPYAAISMGWGGWPDKVHKPGVANFSRENVVTQNLIFDLMGMLSDGGGIYTQGLTGPTLAEGEKVTANVVRDQSSSGHAIYTDNGSCNITVAGNVMFHTNHDNWGSRHADYYNGADGKTNDPLLIEGNYWQQGDADVSAKGVAESGNHLIVSLDQVPTALLEEAGLEPAFRKILAESFTHPTVPEPPTRVAADAEDGCAFVTWSPACFEGGSPVISYEVTASSGERAVVSSEEFRNRGYARIIGLANGKTQTFTVSAINTRGASVTSLPSRPVVPERRGSVTPPSAPLRVSARIRDGNASIHWEGPLSDGGGPILAYVVTVNPGGRQVVFEGRKILTLGTSPKTGNGHQTFDVIGGVPAGKGFTFSIAAVNAAGAGTPAVVPPDRAQMQQ